MGYRRRRCYRCRRLSVALIGLSAALVAGGCSFGGGLGNHGYTVRRGDTLYSIAQSHRLDWHDLARWNKIRPPYRIEIGQRLTLAPARRFNGSPGHASPRRRAPRVVRAPQDTRAQQQAAIQASTPQLTRTIEHAEPTPPREQTSPANKPPSARREQPRPGQPRPQSTPPDGADASQTPAPANPAGPGEDGWQWPASGTLVGSYASGRARRGINIGGRAGSPVYAASSGKVVYNGTGLKGYGQLIIIKHDAHFLSAYGFIRDSRVSQGRTVAAGARIAEMGRGPQNKPMLHFEVRHDGTPIDPESVLPAH